MQMSIGTVMRAVVLGSMAVTQLSAVGIKAQQGSSQEVPAQEFSSQMPILKPEAATEDLPALPAVPEKKSTILGGSIGKVDPVRDVITLKPFGQRPMKIQFDERTEVYRDGKRIPLLDLHAADHASVQTVLDGTDVFAVSIHILAQLPEGEFQGQVQSYDPRSGALTVGTVLSRSSVLLQVPMNTPIVREGESEFTSVESGPGDLVKGALVSVTFEVDKSGRDVASHIAVMATPGARFVFSGNLSSLDTHAGVLVVVDEIDQKSHQIYFESKHFPISRGLHPGEDVSVDASFDGKRYVATAITPN